jgi:hypothetical protein
MQRAQVLTPRAGNGTPGNKNRPQLRDDYPAITFSDVTAQAWGALPPDPNLYVIEITCEDATLTAIEADATYQILWSEVIDES